MKHINYRLSTSHKILLCCMLLCTTMCTTPEQPAAEEKVSKSHPAQLFSITASSLSIRKQPQKEADRIGLLPFGTKVKAKPLDKGEWYELADIPGFVFGKYLSPTPAKKQKSLRLEQATYYDDANLFQDMELKNGLVVYQKSMSFYYDEAPFHYTQKGTYSIGKDGLVVSLEPTTYTVGGEKNTAKATTITLHYKSKLKGYITSDMETLIKDAQRTDYKSFTWEIDNYSQTWWHVTQKK